MRQTGLALYCIAIILGFLLNGGDVFAQGQSQITISPLNFELSASAGERASNVLSVINPSTSVVTIQMQVEDFAVVGEEGQVIVEPAETETYSLARWVTVTPDIFTLQPGERQVVEFFVDVPVNAEPGGHYGSILASTIGASGKVGPLLGQWTLQTTSSRSTTNTCLFSLAHST